MQKISPFLWFNDNAEEAIAFYTSIFKDSKLVSTIPGPNGKMMGATFLLNGQQFMALNGGSQFKFTEAISLFVDCEDQEEVDQYWYKLLEGGGQKSMCGWLKDKYGLSWQIIPKQLGLMLSDKDPKKAQAVMNAMLKMDKIDVETLRQAYASA
jgi:predicted 3-demethylubiquinone-9 3-methyltransferase (glyoxalase superfamily)